MTNHIRYIARWGSIHSPYALRFCHHHDYRRPSFQVIIASFLRFSLLQGKLLYGGKLSITREDGVTPEVDTSFNLLIYSSAKRQRLQMLFWDFSPHTHMDTHPHNQTGGHTETHTHTVPRGRMFTEEMGFTVSAEAGGQAGRREGGQAGKQAGSMPTEIFFLVEILHFFLPYTFGGYAAIFAFSCSWHYCEVTVCL